MFLRLLAAMLATAAVAGDAHSIDRVRIGVSNYNLSNLTVGVAQTRISSNKRASTPKSFA
jgi:hypothetical protein